MAHAFVNAPQDRPVFQTGAQKELSSAGLLDCTQHDEEIRRRQELDAAASPSYVGPALGTLAASDICLAKSSD